MRPARLVLFLFSISVLLACAAHSQVERAVIHVDGMT